VLDAETSLTQAVLLGQCLARLRASLASLERAIGLNIMQESVSSLPLEHPPR
jgi:hypothetical protein